jgi:hypothetical protein
LRHSNINIRILLFWIGSTNRLIYSIEI